jgi:UV excision repair protein RAD23
MSHLLTANPGKILQDSNTVESYKIEEKGFIVCMISKVFSLPFPMIAFA